jgi:hypothetical protein
MTEQVYTALVYNTVTGIVIYEVPFSGDPDWSAQINDPGTWSVTVPIETEGQATTLREWIVPWRFSVAIVYGEFVCQAGPVVAYNVDEATQSVRVSGTGLWGLLNHRLLHNNTWNPASKSVSDVSADLVYTDSLYNIAQSLVTEGTTWTNRAGSTLPIDIPAANPAGGSYAVTYHGYDLNFVGLKLQELTQADGGPDILFQPYLSVTSNRRVVRHKMLIGTPLLIQPGTPLLFDYPSSVPSISVAGDGAGFASSAFARGSGSDAGTQIGYATSTTLTSLGWPAVDMVDSAHTNTVEIAALNLWAAADVATYSGQLEQWTATVRTDRDPGLAVYLPGHYANYQVMDHVWIPDGTYNFRILGLSHKSGDQPHTVTHSLHAVKK